MNTTVLQYKKIESRVEKFKVRGHIRYIGSLKTDFDVRDAGRALRNHSQRGVGLGKQPMNL
jgi:hypothetical protein